MKKADTPVLEFERAIVDLKQKVDTLREQAPDLGAELKTLEARTEELQSSVFESLTPWETVLLSRHPGRPHTSDYLQRLIVDFTEVHGDRRFADDAAIVSGFGFFDGTPVVCIGHQKGRTTKEKQLRNFAQPRPEGYRKALRVMELAARFGRPILTFIDTQGAYPGVEAEERGQAEAIAKNLEVMASLPVPIICVVIGEGGSGGALAIGVGDRILMLKHSVYSVISPEGCASILWRDGEKKAEAAAAMKMTAHDLKRLGVIDEVVAEPPGGAHRDFDAAAGSLGEAIRRHLAELEKMSISELLEERYNKFRNMGAFVETTE
jgi:acetyl-CoA carboxylase carboxyl transferase subunit alpha